MTHTSTCPCSRVALATGTWGINPGEFSSATSSPLWTALLAAIYGVIGPGDLIPLWLNGLLSLVLVYLCGRWLLSEQVRGVALAAGRTALVLLTPLPFLAGLGMEHVLHTVLALTLAWIGVRAISAPPDRLRLILLGLLAGVLPMVRYEALFLTGALGLLLLVRGRWLAGASVWVISAIPVLLYGGWSVANGSAMVPNSLLMKSGMATTWYVDATGGMDTNGGTTTGSAWKALGKVNSTTLSPGAWRRLPEPNPGWTGQQQSMCERRLRGSVSRLLYGRDRDHLPVVADNAHR